MSLTVLEKASSVEFLPVTQPLNAGEALSAKGDNPKTKTRLALGREAWEHGDWQELELPGASSTPTPPKKTPAIMVLQQWGGGHFRSATLVSLLTLLLRGWAELEGSRAQGLPPRIPPPGAAAFRRAGRPEDCQGESRQWGGYIAAAHL